MRFLSVRPDFCRRLPSDSTSRWTPLPLAICFPSLGRIRDFHPLEHAHAGRTKKSGRKLFQPDHSDVSIPHRSCIPLPIIHMEGNRRIQCRDILQSGSLVPSDLSCNTVLKLGILPLGQHNQESGSCKIQHLLSPYPCRSSHHRMGTRSRIS